MFGLFKKSKSYSEEFYTEWKEGVANELITSLVYEGKSLLHRDAVDQMLTLKEWMQGVSLVDNCFSTIVGAVGRRANYHGGSPFSTGENAIISFVLLNSMLLTDIKTAGRHRADIDTLLNGFCKKVNVSVAGYDTLPRVLKTWVVLSFCAGVISRYVAPSTSLDARTSGKVKSIMEDIGVNYVQVMIRKMAVAISASYSSESIFQSSKEYQTVVNVCKANQLANKEHEAMFLDGICLQLKKKNMPLNDNELRFM